MRWGYRIKAYAGTAHKSPFGTMVIETVHKGESSRDMEITAFKSRMKRKEISRIEVIYLVEPYGTKTIHDWEA